MNIAFSCNNFLVSDWLRDSNAESNDQATKSSSSNQPDFESDKTARARRALQLFQSQLIALANNSATSTLVFGVLRDVPIDFMAVSFVNFFVPLIIFPIFSFQFKAYFNQKNKSLK